MLLKLFKSLSPLVFLVLFNCSPRNYNQPLDQPLVESTFTNPIMDFGPDPWIIRHNKVYYFTHTAGNKVILYRTEKVTDLKHALSANIFIPPAGTSYSKQLWAPELHRLNGKWYVYFAADDGDNRNHRMYVLENSSADPMNTEWEFKGKIAAKTDKWAIDGTVLEYQGKMFFIWSGWEGNQDGRQDLYIAKMSNPWTIEGDRVLISKPDYDWEKQGFPDVNEGPEVLKSPKGDVFVVFSASHCSTDNYALGLLKLKKGGNPLEPSDWVKSPLPVFSSSSAQGAYGPGHNAFFKSVDGKEDWIIYHANSSAGQGCGNRRNPRIQKFSWNVDGTPNFGTPVGIDVKIKKPSGE